jgi:hypothetical protein
MARPTKKHAGIRIFTAQRAAERLLARASSEHKATMSLSRDEVKALADQLADVATIAAEYHLERQSAGALPSDAFPGPTE